MNEKEMAKHIKALTKVIDRQAEYAEQMMRRFFNTDRSITILQRQLERLQGMKDD